MSTNTIFLTTATTGREPAVRLMIDSLRSFGGELADAPFWVFTTGQDPVPALEDKHTRFLPFSIPDPLFTNPFGDKVAACAQAEELAPAGTRSLVWIDSTCLVVQPPVLFELGTDCDAAFRPVHIRNVGLSPSEPLDAFWRGIYEIVGVDDISSTVESFVDGQRIRTYFNTHAFAFNPALGLMRGWYERFERLVADRQFQASACADERHQIFLFQALLSAIVASSLDPQRVRILPPAYNYPYNLHERVPVDRRPAAFDELVCFTYEGRSIHPDAVTGIEVREPLRSWLISRLSNE